MNDNDPGRADRGGEVPRYGTPEYAEWYARRIPDPIYATAAQGSGMPPRKSRAKAGILSAVAVLVAIAAGVGIGVVATGGGGEQKEDAAAPTATISVLDSVKAPQTKSPSAQPTTPPAPSPSASPSERKVEDFATIYARQRSGVVRIDVVGCSDAGVGTGFLLSPTLVATVNHVVAGSVVVGLTDQGQRTTGQVIGTDPAHDLALVRAARPLTGYHFRFASTTPRVGDLVAAIGFPIGGPITLTQGGISGLQRVVPVDGRTMTGMVETDAAVNPGNSGGPLLDNSGTVTGLVDALNTEANGIAYAVPAGQAAADMETWKQSPQPQPPADCSNPLGPSQTDPNLPSIPGLTPDASAGITRAFTTYFDGINSGDYAAAYNVLSPRMRSHSTLESFSTGDSTSYDFDITVLAAGQPAPQSATVALAFTSLQAPEKGPDGDACDNWTLSYRMIQGADGAWYIDGTAPYGSSTHTAC